MMASENELQAERAIAEAQKEAARLKTERELAEAVAAAREAERRHQDAMRRLEDRDRDGPRG